MKRNPRILPRWLRLKNYQFWGSLKQKQDWLTNFWSQCCLLLQIWSTPIRFSLKVLVQTGLSQVCQLLTDLLKWVRQRWRFVAAVMLFPLAFVIHFFVNQPFPFFAQTFEGNLIVRQLDFTYTGESDRLFLNDVRRVQQIDLVSQEQQILILVGLFESSQEPHLNKLDELAIVLESGGQLSITPDHPKCTTPNNPKSATSNDPKSVTLNNPKSTSPNNPKPTPPKDSECTTLEGSKVSGLRLKDLKLQQNTAVEALQYVPSERLISFSLIPINPKTDNQQGSQLVLDSGREPLKITLTGYQISDSKLGDRQDDNHSQPLEFKFIPSGETQLRLTQPTKIEITLPNPKTEPFETIQGKQPNAQVRPIDFNPRLFWGDFDVRDVKFIEKEKNQTDQTDNYDESTILEGAVRMADQSLSLEKDQFLSIAAPGIQNLRHIRIVDSVSDFGELQIAGGKLKLSDPSQGLEVAFQGTTSHIEVGIRPNFPVADIKSTALTKFSSKDATPALYAFFSALLGLVVMWLLGNPTQSNSGSQ